MEARAGVQNGLNRVRGQSGDIGCFDRRHACGIEFMQDASGKRKDPLSTALKACSGYQNFNSGLAFLYLCHSLSRKFYNPNWRTIASASRTSRLYNQDTGG